MEGCEEKEIIAVKFISQNSNLKSQNYIRDYFTASWPKITKISA